jgi:hypothetical protein
VRTRANNSAGSVILIVRRAQFLDDPVPDSRRQVITSPDRVYASSQERKSQLEIVRTL